MTKIIRDKRTGDYYTQDRKYMIEKGCDGWNVNELTKYGYEYSFTTETLKEAKESL